MFDRSKTDREKHILSVVSVMNILKDLEINFIEIQACKGLPQGEE